MEKLNKKIKVIELLNDIYNGKNVPKKICLKEKYIKSHKDEIVFEYDEEYKMYCNNNADEFYTTELITGFVSIFDEVYILEN